MLMRAGCAKPIVSANAPGQLGVAEISGTHGDVGLHLGFPHVALHKTVNLDPWRRRAGLQQAFDLFLIHMVGEYVKCAQWSFYLASSSGFEQVSCHI